jgi:GNAT superfamily N-acetyltransferase
LEIGPIEGPEVPACAGIFFDAMNDLHRRTNVPPEDPADDSWLRHALRHFLRTDPHRTALVRSQEHPIAFGTAYRRERFWFLAFLFVRPGSQASGVGRAIIEHLLPDAHERVEITLATMVESFQPVSTGLYARFGMAPRTPRYRLTGVRSLEALPALPEDVLVEPMTAARIEACGELDRTLLGYRRPQDHAWWLETDATAVAYLSGSGALIGYGYMDEEGYIGPVASGDQLLTSAIVRDLLGRLPSPEAGKLSVFGSSGVLLARLLDAGLRIGDEHGPAPFIYCSNDGAKPEPSYVGYSGYLV